MVEQKIIDISADNSEELTEKVRNETKQLNKEGYELKNIIRTDDEKSSKLEAILIFTKQ